MDRAIRMLLISRTLLFIAIVLSSFFSSAQELKYSLKLDVSPAEKNLGALKIPERFSDSLSVVQALNSLISKTHSQGYLLAEIKSIKWDGRAAEAKILLNTRYQLVKLQNGNIGLSELQESGYREQLFANVPFNAAQLEGLFKNLLSVYENSGYPFASVWMDSIKIVEGNISAKIFADKNRYFIFDTLSIVGNVSLDNVFAQNYLGIKRGAAYNEKQVQNLNNRLTEFAFAQSVKSPQVTFFGDRAKVSIFLERKNANQFDGIIGFLPNSNTGKIELTGDINLKIQNSFKHAEIIAFNFKGLPQLSRELGISFNSLALFSSPVGLNASFNLYRQDTSYQNLNFKISLAYHLANTSYIDFFVGQHIGNLTGTQGLKALNVLPSFADISTTFYGIGFQSEMLNNRINPTKGYKFKADAAVGNKHFRPNSFINPVLYKNIQLNSAQYRMQLRGDVFVPAGKISTINIASQTGILIGKDFFDNELYRLGGFADLRGFNEQSILANAYTFLKAEYRYMLEQNSFLFLFANQAYIQRQAFHSLFQDYPLGFGAGINLQTKAGVVSLSYAVGKQHNKPLNLQDGKIHFGIIEHF